MSQFSITLPWPPNVLNPNKRVHWAIKARAVKAYKESAFYAAKASGNRIEWNGSIYVRVEFYPPDNRLRDDDNLHSAFKSGRDGIAMALGVNDARFRSHPCIMEPTKGGMVIAHFSNVVNY